MKIYVVDSFTNRAFTGNPAGVCILEEKISDNLMLKIAGELKHSETAFIFIEDNNFFIRWFTPETEVPLCGHGTIAAAHILWEEGYINRDQNISFQTKESGILNISYSDYKINMDFPQMFTKEIKSDEPLLKALGITPIYISSDNIRYLVELNSEDDVRNLKPDFNLIKKLNKRVIITAKSNSPEYHFVSRMFAPSIGIDEDPVTGSAHCYLAPYWSKKLNKTTLIGYQVSFRPGIITCILTDNKRVTLQGSAKTIIKGELCL